MFYFSCSRFVYMYIVSVIYVLVSKSCFVPLLFVSILFIALRVYLPVRAALRVLETKNRVSFFAMNI